MRKVLQVLWLSGVLLAISFSAFAQTREYLEVGQKVWNQSGTGGVIAALFPNGDVSVKFNHYSQVYRPEQLAVETCITREVCSGSKVYSRQGQEAILLGVSLNKERLRLVQFNHYNSYVKKEDLGLSGCELNLCAGDKVLTRTGQEGSVLAFFLDRTVLVKLNHYTQVYKVADLGRTYVRGGMPKDSQWQRYKIGEKAYTRQGQVGVLVAIFPNGELSVKFNHYTSNVSAENIALEGCFDHLCSGDKVILRNGQTGTVNGVFSNGDVSVQLNHYSTVVSRQDVGITR